MLIMFIYMLFMFMGWFFLLMLIIFFKEKLIILEWMIYSYNSMKFSFFIYLDFYSMMFLMLVSLISMVVLIYSIYYMKGDKFMNRFIILVILFVISMYLMILSPSFLTILLGWDGLGLISYCLIIYYQNEKAYNAGMLTIFSNRIGDVGILLMITMGMMFGSWNLMVYKFNLLMLILLVLVAFTKSAQIPFTLWLPAAMMAPTPVSSLVHSSTLVTAGVYLLIRYNKFLFLDYFNKYILLISSLTMFMAGLIANYEYDFKKIIALSTLSQLSLMMSILSLGFWEMAFFHLVIHALFKSLMFLCVGSFIHNFNSSQDIRCYGGMMYIYPFKTMVLIFSLLCLMGFPFMSGYFSKDMIMELIFLNKMNLISMMFLIFSTIFTVSYSIRLIMFILFSKKNYYVNLIKKEGILENFCMFILLITIFFMGYLYLKIFNLNYLILLTLNMKIMVMKLIFCGILIGQFFYFNSFKMNMVGNFMSTMFYIEKIYQYYDIPLNLIMLYENMHEKNLFEFKIKFIKLKFYLFKYKLDEYNFLSMLLTNLLMMLIFIILI
uniref:NADH-ubiquinone oxidoreductase chain 5 n=1 Tax=Osmia rufa TaxID=1437190 RepID=A0A0S2LTF6_OSMRU|nr:NADH dehydrogenase subunit 5 [Osmia bicornis]